MKRTYVISTIYLLCYVPTISDCATCRPTTADIQGPFYIPGAPLKETGVLCDSAENGTQLIIRGRVTMDDCVTGVPAILDIWSADWDGGYSLSAGDYACRGMFVTDSEGNFEVETVLPGWYLDGRSYRPAHIHWKITPLNDLANTLTTQLYFENDPFLAELDPCIGICHSGDPTLTVPLQRVDQNSSDVVARWDIVLQSRKIDNFPFIL